MSLNESALPRIQLIQKENLTVQLTLKDGSLNPIDVSSATLQLTLKEALDSTTFKVTIEDASFDKTAAVNGVVSFPLTATNLDMTGTYYGLLKITFSLGNIKKGYFIATIVASEE